MNGTKAADTAPEIPHDTSSAGYWVFIALQLLGFSGSIIILATAVFLRPSVSRSAQWYNFMIAWVVYSFSYLLLFFSGHSGDVVPPFALCVVQSSMIHSVSAYAAAATLSMIVQLSFNVQSAISGRIIRFEKFWKSIFFLLPYAVFLAIFFVNVALNLESSPPVQFYVDAYCSENMFIAGLLTAGGTIVFVVPVLIINIILFIRLRKHWATFRTSSLRHSKTMFIRATCFSTFGLFAVILGVVFFVVFFRQNSGKQNNGIKALNITVSLFPLAGILIFGTHADLLHALAFWRPKSSTGRTSSTPSSRLAVRSYRSGLSGLSSQTSNMSAPKPLALSALGQGRETIRMVEVEVKVDGSEDLGGDMDRLHEGGYPKGYKELYALGYDDDGTHTYGRRDGRLFREEYMGRNAAHVACRAQEIEIQRAQRAPELQRVQAAGGAGAGGYRPWSEDEVMIIE